MPVAAFGVAPRTTALTGLLVDDRPVVVGPRIRLTNGPAASRAARPAALVGKTADVGFADGTSEP